MSRKFKHNAKSFHARIIKKKVKKKNKIKNPKCNLFVCSWLWIISVMIAGVNSEVIDEVLIHLLVIREHKSKYHRICRFLLQLPLDWPIIIVGPCIFFLSSDSFRVENHEGKSISLIYSRQIYGAISIMHCPRTAYETHFYWKKYRTSGVIQIWAYISSL